MAMKPPRRTRAAFRSLNLMLVSALVAQLVLVTGVLNAAPAFAGPPTRTRWEKDILNKISHTHMRVSTTSLCAVVYAKTLCATTRFW